MQLLIVLLSLQVSLLAVVFATLAGFPGTYQDSSPGADRFVSKLLYTLMGLPRWWPI